MRGISIKAVEGPHGSLDGDGRALMTLVIENGLELDVRAESVRAGRGTHDPTDDTGHAK